MIFNFNIFGILWYCLVNFRFYLNSFLGKFFIVCVGFVNVLLVSLLIILFGFVVIKFINFLIVIFNRNVYKGVKICN